MNKLTKRATSTHLWRPISKYHFPLRDVMTSGRTPAAFPPLLLEPGFGCQRALSVRASLVPFCTVLWVDAQQITNKRVPYTFPLVCP